MRHPLKEWLRARGETAEHFAARIDSTASYVSQIMTGYRRPSVELAKAIEAVTDGEVRAADLLLWERRPDSADVDAAGGEAA